MRADRYALASYCMPLCLTLLFALSAPKMFGASTNAAQSKTSPRQAPQTLSTSSLGSLPLLFQENQGQADKNARYVARGAGYTLLLDRDGLRLALRKARPISMKLAGAQMGSVSGREPSPTRTDYYLGNNPADWRLGIRNYHSVAYTGVYRGIDLVYHGSGRQLEYDFVVAPGADPAQVRMRFEGQHLKLQGDYLAFEGLDGLRVKALKAYQWVDGRKKAVEAAWEVHAEQASIHLGTYDRARELIIDPVFFYGTYIGGTGNDSAVSIVPASQPGFYYVALSTTSPEITEPSPSSGSSSANPNTTGIDTLILGINASAAPAPPSPLPPFSRDQPDPYPTLVLNSETYLGGTTGTTKPTAMVGDQNANLYVTGTTDNGGSFSQLASQPCSQPCSGFAGKFSTSADAGSLTPQYIFGLPASPSAIAADGAGNAYLTGSALATTGTQMLTIPAADAAFQSVAAASIGTGANPHAFLLELDPAGATLFCSYLGGSGSDQGNAITIAGSTVVVAGQTSSTDFPTTSAAYQSSNKGGQDAFVLGASNLASSPKLNFSTYLGGSGTDTIASIAVTPSSNLVLAGSTNSPEFPTQPSPSFSKLLWPLVDNVDQNGNHVPALPTSAPTELALPTAVPSGIQDAFVTSLSLDGAHLLFTDFLGGDDTNGVSTGQAVAVDSVGVIYIAGSSTGGGGHFLSGASIGDTEPFDFANPPTGVITNLFFGEIDPTGAYLLEATLAGGYGTDQAGGLTISNQAAANGTVSIVGTTTPNPNSADGTNNPNLFLNAGISVVNPVNPEQPDKDNLSDTTGFFVQEALAGFCDMQLTGQAGTLLTFSGPCVSGTEAGTVFAFPGSSSATGTAFSAPIAVTVSGVVRTGLVTIDVSSLGSDTANFSFAFLPLGAIGGVGTCENQGTSLNGCGIVTAGGGAGTLFKVTSGTLTASLACTGANCSYGGTPNTALVGQPLTLTSAVTNAIPATVNWSSSQGVFSGPNPATSITFTPAGSGGPVVIEATLVADPSLKATSLTLNTIAAAPPPPTLEITASASRIVAGTSFQFTANQPVTWTATAGTIDTNGEFTAPDPPPSPATITITATSQSSPSTLVTTQATVFPKPLLVLPAQNTLIAGGSVSIPISITAGTGIAGESLLFSCAPATLPSGVTCSFSPNPVANSGSAQLTLQLSSNIVGAMSPPSGMPWMPTPLKYYSACLISFAVLLRRRTKWNYAATLSLALLMVLTACGTGGTFSGTSQQGHLTGTYTVDINVLGATAGAADYNQTVTTAPLSITLQ